MEQRPGLDDPRRSPRPKHPTLPRQLRCPRPPAARSPRRCSGPRRRCRRSPGPSRPRSRPRPAPAERSQLDAHRSAGRAPERPAELSSTALPCCPAARELARQPAELSPDQQLIVARWMVKTALLRLVKDAEHPTVAPEPRWDRRQHALPLLRQVMADLAPPVNCLIRLERHSGCGDLLRRLALADEDSRDTP